MKTQESRFTSKALITPTGQPATIRYTKFQKTILAWIGLLGTATVDQLGLVLNRTLAGERNYLYRLLRKMFDLGLVVKKPYQDRDAYLLPQVKVENLAHAVGVSEIVTRFDVAFRAEGVKVAWIKEHEVAYGLVPDAWAIGEKPAVLTPKLFCFEYQRSKKSIAQMKEKLGAYELAEPEFLAMFPVAAVYSLFVLAERFDAFSPRTILKIGRCAYNHTFVTSDRLLKETKPRELLTTLIWWQAYEKDPVPIFIRRHQA